MDDAPEVFAEDRAAWRAWLEANHASVPAVWLVTWRAGHGPRLDYGESIEEALCFGWIDSKSQVLDERRMRLYFAPRKATSNWSGSNKDRVARLVADGRMRPAGLAAIERAKANGSWTRLDAVEAGIVPDDLAAALAAHPPAADNFAAFRPGIRKLILAWIVLAGRPETRAARIRETSERAARGEPSRT